MTSVVHYSPASIEYPTDIWCLTKGKSVLLVRSQKIKGMFFSSFRPCFVTTIKCHPPVGFVEGDMTGKTNMYACTKASRSLGSVVLTDLNNQVTVRPCLVKLK